MCDHVCLSTLAQKPREIGSLVYNLISQNGISQNCVNGSDNDHGFFGHGFFGHSATLLYEIIPHPTISPSSFPLPLSYSPSKDDNVSTMPPTHIARENDEKDVNVILWLGIASSVFILVILVLVFVKIYQRWPRKGYTEIIGYSPGSSM